jgi:hypothetical protein
MIFVLVVADISNSNEDLMMQMKEVQSKLDFLELGREGILSYPEA